MIFKSIYCRNRLMKRTYTVLGILWIGGGQVDESLTCHLCLKEINFLEEFYFYILYLIEVIYYHISLI